MSRFLKGLSAGALTVWLAATPAWAQATAALNGRVTDESGAVLPGVTVTATQTDTGFSRSVVTDGGGAYVMPNLPVGPYQLEISLPGFRTYMRTGIVLQVAATPTINAVLAVGSLEETVAVEAAAPLVDVRSTGISEVIEQQRILELPLQGRQVTDLIVLAGAAVQDAPNNKSMPGSVFTGVAGSLPFGVAYLLDGAAHNNPYDNLNMPLPFPDALQEFRVATSGLSADNGVHSGGTVSAVTKSGTNVFHGTLFEFLRDKRFNSKAVFAPIGPDGKKRDDGLKRNQPGGVLGGPILADRLFFFGAYQGTFLRVTPADAITRIPTPATLAGDFTAFASPACNRGQQVNLRAPFVNNRIDPGLLSPAATAIARQLPTTADPCGDVRFSAPQHYDQHQVVAKVDYQGSGAHSIFGRYMLTSDVQLPGWPASGNVLTTRPEDASQNHRAQSLTLGDTKVFGANTVNAFRVVWNRTRAHYNLEPFFGADTLGIKDFYNYVPGIIGIEISGGFMTASGGSVLFQGDTDAYQISDDVTLVRGSHQIALGGNVAHWTHYTVDGQRGVGLWTFDGSSSGLGMADFLTGRLARLEHARPGVLDLAQEYLGLYAQDTWRVGTRVTLNGGLRWEPFFGQDIKNKAISNFNLDNFRRGVTSTVFRNAPPGFLYPGDPDFPSGKSGLNNKWTNFAPRVGAAWDVTGDGRMAVRSSYSLGYDFQGASYLFISATAPPFGGRLRVTQLPGGLDDPYRGFPGGPPHPYPENPGPDAQFPAYGALASVDPDNNSTRVQSWNVIVERQVGAAWQVSASYLGSYTDRIWAQVQRNAGVFLGTGPCTLAGVSYPTCTTPANLNQRRKLSIENPQASRLIGSIERHEAIGTQTYHALRLSTQRRAASGVSLSANYTRSYCVGNFAQTTFFTGGQSVQDPDNPDWDLGNCTFSRRHIANATVTVATPQFANRALHVLASDWNVAGILSARSGAWLTVMTLRDITATGILQQRVDQVAANPYGDKTLGNYLNRAAFAYPAPGQLGTHTRNSIEGPAYWSIDLALSRRIPLGATQDLELRLETFNLLNHFNWGNPGPPLGGGGNANTVNLDAGNFGQITTQAGTPRIFQFGIRYGF
ncbi:MAG: TonB-dependent receptor [Acidobacteria bacterium]|nr:TonB-dependent receptor [Acidobacteriota bacterium]